MAKLNNESKIKLKWGASNSSLYHLFAQLREMNTADGKTPITCTPKRLAEFLKDSFDINASENTIEREIQKYSANGKTKTSEKKPPRNAINIDKIDFDNEI